MTTALESEESKHSEGNPNRAQSVAASRSDLPEELRDEVGAGVEDASAETRSIDFPAMNDSIVDADTVRALIADIETHTELIEVRVKRGRAARSDAGGTSARDALRWLLDGNGTRRAVQLRYLYHGAEWLDTLMSADKGNYRIVRVRHVWDDAPAGHDTDTRRDEV